MAIYWIDPHTTTNGDGSFASPWTLSSATKTGLANNDEIRIRGVALTSLLTATSYTATVTSNYQLTLTAGGGLGADWTAGDIGYLPAFDTFFRVNAVNFGTILQLFGTSSMLPIHNWSTTTVTVRRVDTTTYPAGGSSTSLTIGTATALNNITVSDCWTDATTRVTDGTVKTLMYTAATTSVTSFFASVQGNTTSSGWTINLQNTAVVCPNVTSNAAVALNLNSTSSTLNIGQVYGFGSSTSGGITLGVANGNSPVDSSTINITSFAGQTVFKTTSFTGQNNTVNITNLVTYGADALFGSAGTIATPNNTVNITNYFPQTGGTISSGVFIYVLGGIGCPEFNLNFTGVIDQYGATAPTILVSGFGRLKLSIGSSVTYYYNKRVSTLSSIAIGVAYSGGFPTFPAYVPTFSLPSGWAVTTKYSLTTAATNTCSANEVPNVCQIIYPESTGVASNTPYGINGNQNILVTYSDGSAPKEILGIRKNAVSNSTSNQFATVTSDSSVYRTSGPSLKSYLATRTTTYWVSPLFKSRKTIKIPCTSGTSYTVAGFIRTDDTAYTDGDCRVSIYLNDEEIVGQDMTTACENAWEGFSLSFTAAQTAEYVLVWSMYYANGAKSYWLDDLTIS